MSLPKILYKYYSPNSIEYIDKAEPTIRYTPTAEFNDPFEFQPSGGSLPTRIDLEVKLDPEPIIHHPRPDMCIWEGGVDVNLELREVVRQRSGDLSSDEHQIGRAGILCLTKNCKNILMWSHYSCMHKGFCVGFDPYHKYFSIDNSNGAPIRKFYPVKYLKDRPSVQNVRHKMYRFLYIKSIIWKYEKEWRLVKSLLPPYPECPADVGVEKFPLGAIKSMIVGIRVEDKLREKIKNMCNNHEIDYYEAKRSNGDYEIEIVRVEL